MQNTNMRGDYVMNDKNSKAPIYIVILIAVILIAAGGYFVLGGTSNMTPETKEETNENTPVPTAKETSQMTEDTPAKTSSETRQL